MPPADFCPAVAGRMFYCLDRLADPDQLVTAEQPVPGHPQLWVVRDVTGHKFVCAELYRADRPAGEAY